MSLFYNSLKYYIVGFFIFVLIVLFFYKIFLSSDSGSKYYRYKSYFSNANSLTVNSPVVVSGYNVGKVSKVYLDNNYTPAVILSINKDVYIPDDSSLSIKEDGIFSNKIVQLNLGISDTVLKNNDIISYTNSGISILELIDLLINYASTIKKSV